MAADYRDILQYAANNIAIPYVKRRMGQYGKNSTVTTLRSLANGGYGGYRSTSIHSGSKFAPSRYLGARKMGYRKRRYYKRYVLAKHVELKHVTTAATDSEFNNAGAIMLLNGCTQGSGPSQRVGQRVFNKYLQITGIITPGDQDNTVRVSVVLCKDVQGTAPVLTDIWDQTGVPAMPYYNALRLPGHFPEFKFLYDERFHINAATEAFSGFPLNIFKYLGFKEVFNTGNAGDVTDIEKMALYLIITGDKAAGPSPHNAMLTIQARVRFTDL